MLALLKTFPFKGSHHCCDAASVVVVIGDKSSSAALSSFQHSYVDVTNSCCFFQLGPDKCLVASFLDVLIVTDQHSKVLCILGVAEFFVMDDVMGINTFPLLGDPNYLAFVGVE